MLIFACYRYVFECLNPLVEVEYFLIRNNEIII
jgi:hypothetical protein